MRDEIGYNALTAFINAIREKRGRTEMRLSCALVLAWFASGLAASGAGKFDSPKNTYLTWETAAKLPLGSPEMSVLAECFTEEASRAARDAVQLNVIAYIVKNKFEFAEERVTGDSAVVLLKNPQGKTLQCQIRKQGDRWLINRLPDVRAFYWKLLDMKVVIPVCVVLLIIGLWLRRAAIRAASEREE